ncbi:MAG: hypothetical protein HFH82_16845 [Lachnospiraceae bacterium]|nr:hypothetical protein [Lachnospiraceae bacterium]
MGNLKVADILRQLSSTLNKEKMAFIICCNDDQYQAECVSYLNELELPEAFEIEIISVTGAKSMAAGYNQGMKQTDAKYKVYLHQDVFIWNSRFIYDVLKIFENKAVGMIGVLGGVNIPNDGVLYRAWNVGMTYASDTQDTGIKQGKNPKQDICQEVEAVDGMLMATQYDLSWREDLFDGWDFYDISQSFEFRKAGYLVVVPHQEQPWCMHDCGRTKLQNYNQGRKKLLQEYACFFQNPIYREEDFFYNYDLKRQYQNMTDKIVQSMEQGLLDEAGLLCNQYDDAVIMDSELSILKKIISVCSVERELYGGVQSWHKGETYKTVKKRYYNLKFLLWDMERCRNSRKEGFVYVMKQDLYSIPFIVLVGIHHMFHFEQLLPVLAEYAVTGKDVKGLDYLKMIAQQISLAESIPFDVMRKELAPVPFFYKTKEEVSEIEKSWEIMAGVWEIELPEYRTRINRLLKEENRGELSALLASAEFCSKFDSVTDMAYMMIANQIYEEELQGGVNHTIFDGRSSIEEVMSLIQEIKFGLWRVEFDMEEAPGVQFIEMVRTHHISGYFLKYMVYVAGMDKVGLLGRLVAIFLECNMQGMAFSMLKYANELCPGTEEILGTMAELCIQVGKKEEAVYCLAQVKQPTQITEKLRKLCEET